MEKFTIIVPTYNEKDNVKLLVDEIEKYLSDIDYEILFVDDSNDGTEKEVEKIQKENKNVRCKHRTKDKGLSKAVIEGINLAKGDIIAVIDADLQHPPYLLRKMYDEMINGADFVIPSRFIKGGNDGGLNLYRKFVSFTARMLAKVHLLNLRKISDISSGIFCFRKSNLLKEYELNGIGWKIMLEVLCKSKFTKLVEIPYKFNQRNAGVSKMNKKVMLEYLEQLKLLRKNHYKNKYKVEKKVGKNREKTISFIAFLIPIIIMFAIFIIKGVWFNSEKLSFGDMQAQYIDMLIYIKGVLLGDNNVFYSIYKGLGGSIYSTFAYYMLSPFNLLTVFFKNENIMDFVYLSSLVKIGLAGYTMNKLLKYQNKKEPISRLILSSCYALMTFNVATYFCVMWSDVIYMAPLVVLGIEKLIKEEKVSMYIISLFFSLVFSFYLGYMLCIFSVIYFIYKMVITYSLSDYKIVGKKALKFLIASLIAGLLSSFIWLPTIIDMLKTSRGDVASETTVASVIKTIFIGSYTDRDMLFYHQPCLYCGMIVLFLILAYLFNKKNNNVEKAATLTVIAIFIASILVKQLSYFWHGFSYPIGYNYRFVFLFILFLVTIAHKELINMEKLKKKQIIWLVVCIILTAIIINNYYDTTFGWISLGLLVLYLIIMSSKLQKLAKCILILVVTLIELAVNANMSFYKADNQTTMKDYMAYVCDNIGYEDNYRIFEYGYYGTDSNIACNRSATSGFYSTLNSNIVNFYNKVGLSGGANVYNDNIENTPIVHALLGVKYVYSYKPMYMYDLKKEIIVKKESLDQNSYYEEKNYLYENPYALSYGYMIKSSEKVAEENVFEYQNKLFQNITGIDYEKDILIEIKNKKKNKKLKDAEYIYIIAFENNNGFKINDVDYATLEPGQMLAIQNSWNKDEIDITFNSFSGEQSNYLAYYMDEELFESGIKKLKENELKNVVIDKNIITGEIDVKEPGTLMLSIPYENDFKIYVDGKKVNYKKIYEMFIAVKLDNGKHEIKLKYIPNTFIYGAVTSGFSLLILGAFIVENNKERKNEQERNDK